tara:strand:+ start:122097 stop:125042 length:2946 start_codon:yes stop_codon:yes gene_type:complete
VVLAFIFATLALSFQNCGTQNFHVDQASELPSNEIKANNDDLSNGGKSLSTAVPKISLLSAPDMVSASLYSVSFKVSGIEASQIKNVTCQLNESAPVNCSDNSFTVDFATDGDYKIKIMVETLAGIKSDVSKLVRKDATAPQVSLINTPNPISNESSTVVSFNVVDTLSGIDRIECSLDNAAFTKCTSPLTLNSLSSGSHTLSIQAFDVLKNKSNVKTLTWSVDLSLPTLSFSQTPASLTNTSAASFEFMSTSAISYQCQLDNAAYTTCTSPKSFSGLSNGSHTFKVKATNALGTVSSELSYSWTIDLSIPTLTISQMPASITNSTSAAFAFSGSGIVSYECQLDGAAFAACSSPKAYTSLAAGNHIFSVRGKSNAGTLSNPVSYSWAVNLQAPTISWTQLPAALSASSSVNFTFSGANVTRYECRLDGGAYFACASPHSQSGLTDKTHTFEVRGFNSLGIVSNVLSYNWITDLTSPSLPMISINVPVYTTSRSATLTFNSNDSNGVGGYICRINSEPEFTCSSPYTYTANEDATLTFSLVAVDSVGNKSAKAIQSWTTDATPPSAPSLVPDVIVGTSRSSSITFTFSGFDSGSNVDSYRCLLDGVTGWNPCTSPKTLSDLKDGRHVFEVSAVDKAGNVSQSTKYTWDISTVTYTAIANGGNHACGLTSDKKVKCTGWNGFGALGIGIFDSYESGGIKTVDVLNLSNNIVAVSAGNYHSCALTSAGDVKCWGDAIANGTAAKSSVPVNVPGLSGIKAISSGGSHTCAITSDDKVRCWGSSTFGELGNGSTASSATPVEVSGLTGVSSIYTTMWYSCAISGGLLKCWGNLNGHMSGSDSSVPVTASPLSGLKSACLGTNHTCVIGSDDKVKCWGDNSKGMLGNGTTTSSSTPVDVSGLGTVKSISCYTGTTCAITSDNTVKCWGDNSLYQLGNGTTASSSVPVAFKTSEISSAAAVGSGPLYTCALRTNGYVTCSGNMLAEW